MPGHSYKGSKVTASAPTLPPGATLVYAGSGVLEWSYSGAPVFQWRWWASTNPTGPWDYILDAPWPDTSTCCLGVGDYAYIVGTDSAGVPLTQPSNIVFASS